MKKGSIISIALMFVSVLITQNVIAGIEGDEYNNVLNYRYHEPILIDGNNNYTLTNGVISGSGTIFDPYLIMGWSINDSNNNGITINNTDLYFIIRDCKIMNCKSGIYFNNVKNGIIEFNNIKNNY